MVNVYEIKLDMDEYEDGTRAWLVTVPDFPEITTYGDDKKEAYANAIGAIEEAIASRMHYNEDVPIPMDGVNGKGCFVGISSMVILKSSLYGVCRLQGVSKTELARRMNKHRPTVDRMFDVNHASRLSQFDNAAKALGLSLNISFEGNKAA